MPPEVQGTKTCLQLDKEPPCKGGKVCGERIKSEIAQMWEGYSPHLILFLTSTSWCKKQEDLPSPMGQDAQLLWLWSPAAKWWRKGCEPHPEETQHQTLKVQKPIPPNFILQPIWGWDLKSRIFFSTVLPLVWVNEEFLGRNSSILMVQPHPGFPKAMMRFIWT